MLVNQVIVDRSAEHRSHRNIGLFDRAACVPFSHPIEDHFAVNRFHLREEHAAYDRANISIISLTVIPQRARCQIAHDILDPVIKPLIDRHVCRNEDLAVTFQIPCVIQPVPGFMECFEEFLLSFPGSACEPGSKITILSLADTLATFFAF